MENQISAVFWNILFPILATAAVGYIVWWLQRRSKSTPLEILINEIQEERNELKKDKAQWKVDYESQKQRISELETKVREYLAQIDDFEKVKRNLSRRIETLEGEAKAHDKERDKWLMEKTSLMATLNNQNDKISEQNERISELTRQYKAVKSSTDELRKQTAELKLSNDDKTR